MSLFGRLVHYLVGISPGATLKAARDLAAAAPVLDAVNKANEPSPRIPGGGGSNHVSELHPRGYHTKCRRRQAARRARHRRFRRRRGLL